MLPPIAVINQTVTAYGRTYTAAPGTVVDVPINDAAILAANGWVPVAYSGHTADRPSGTLVLGDADSKLGGKFLDIDINKLVVFDGRTWRDPSTGAAA